MDETPQKNGIDLIAAERLRQLEVERWTPEHDDRFHDAGELAIAAMCYAAYAGNLLHPNTQGDGDWRTTPPEWWPWGKSWWKPTDDPVRALEKAGALIAAEIDRQLRLEAGAGDSVSDRGIEHADGVSSEKPGSAPPVSEDSPSPAKLDATIRYQDYRQALDLLREAHGRMGNTAFPALAARIATFLKTAPSPAVEDIGEVEEEKSLGIPGGV